MSETNPPQITILIPVYNGDRFIERTIKSVLNQTYDNLIMIVADNYSKDNTRTIVRKYLKDPRITLIERPRNIGHIKNFNSCLRLLNTPYYMLLCSDDLLYSRYSLEMAVNVFETNPLVPAVYCDMVYINENDRPIMKRKFKRYGLISSEDLARKSFINNRNCFGIPLLIRTDAVKNVSYDEALQLAGDIDFSLASSRDNKIYRIPEVLIANRYHNTNLSSRLHINIFLQMQRIAKKNGIELGNKERLLMRLNYYIVTIQKLLFFYYLKLRSS